MPRRPSWGRRTEVRHLEAGEVVEAVDPAEVERAGLPEAVETPLEIVVGVRSGGVWLRGCGLGVAQDGVHAGAPAGAVDAYLALVDVVQADRRIRAGSRIPGSPTA